MANRRERRTEDMSPDGSLDLMQCEDGDITVTVSDGCGLGVMVEFTLSGGHSPHTIEALRYLMDAMRRDTEGVPWPTVREATEGLADGG